ncbi:MAG: YicC family protein [Firmicutes bacterium]|nr:YicC family protein [Bacillota bacterium]
MKSMTGYGKGEAADGSGRKVTIELKSVNNRYLEINTRLPRALQFCDDIIRKILQSVLVRGTVDMFFSYENRTEGGKAVVVDWPLARAYVRASQSIIEELPVEDDFGVAALMRTPDVIITESVKEDPEAIGKLAAEAAEKAVSELDKMRAAEGAGIKTDLVAILGSIQAAHTSVALRAPQVVAQFRAKIEARMREILDSVALDEAKLLNECAFFADKADIHEELSRLSSHIGQFLKCIELSGPQGRKLDFIAQEMNREINTIGSKSNDLEITNLVILMKNELEKLKEQIRNVE